MERKKSLLTFFTVSVAAFDFADAIARSTGKERSISNVEDSHRALLSELVKPKPNMIWVELELMNLQSMVEQNAREAGVFEKKFPSGGLVSE